VTPQERGFTLIELAIVMLVLTILAAGLLLPLTTNIEMKRYEATQKILLEAREALIGYAMSHKDATGKPYLPCPDKTSGITSNLPNDGIEDRTTTPGPGFPPCDTPEGNFPWATLGVGNADAWGNRLRYRVEFGYSDSTNGFSSASPPPAAIQICNQSGCPANSIVAAQLPAVILSFGKNGWGAINSNTPIGANGVPQASPTSADELENVNGNWNYVSRAPTEASPTTTEFDDLVVWLPTAMLFSRVCPEGGCP
jgi:prepilin-type N-terminal cleavage/methylation domain-containing protein